MKNVTLSLSVLLTRYYPVFRFLPMNRKPVAFFHTSTCARGRKIVQLFDGSIVCLCAESFGIKGSEFGPATLQLSRRHGQWVVSKLTKAGIENPCWCKKRNTKVSRRHCGPAVNWALIYANCFYELLVELACALMWHCCKPFIAVRNLLDYIKSKNNIHY